jgi:hypothetical protein
MERMGGITSEVMKEIMVIQSYGWKKGIGRKNGGGFAFMIHSI